VTAAAASGYAISSWPTSIVRPAGRDKPRRADAGDREDRRDRLAAREGNATSSRETLDGIGLTAEPGRAFRPERPSASRRCYIASMWTSELAIERVRARSVVTRSRAASPLRLLAPTGGGHAAWVYQSSLGGGFVGNDAVALRVEVCEQAALFLSSQASSKVYRATRSRFSLDAVVAQGATLIAWPDPITCFAGASFDQTQRFALAGTANLIVVDAWTAGRVARGERWAFERLATRVAVAIDGEPVLDDGLLLSPAHGDLDARLGGADAFATIVMVGPSFEPTIDALAAQIASRRIDAAPLIAASRWPWGLVVRVAARQTEALATTCAELLRSCVIDALGADPLARKW
jgi:urease accessory protein